MKALKANEKFLELRAQGKSLRSIEKEIGIDRRTLAKWGSESKEELENRKAVELEALREKYWLTEHARIERFGKQLERVVNELEKRDLSNVATPKLVDLALKLDAALSDGNRRSALKAPDTLKDVHGDFALSREYIELRQEVLRVLSPQSYQLLHKFDIVQATHHKMISGKPNQQALYNLFAAYLHTVPLEELIERVERER